MEYESIDLVSSYTVIQDSDGKVYAEIKLSFVSMRLWMIIKATVVLGDDQG